MALGRLKERPDQDRSAEAEPEPLSRRTAYLFIAAGSILVWALFISAGIAILRLL
jgi:hypothetical protein